ncbi:MAG: IS21-like element helper ATPase IstB [Gammaproteobacteria bacterium]|nr:IS21-like element helper ATPase IstB [Gammaproteobacteria bacterium]
MLHHPTLDKLHTLKFTGMATALTEQMALSDINDLDFDERLGLLVDREFTEREDRRMKSRLRQAKLKQQACMEDMNYRHPRGLDKTLLLGLQDCQWVKKSLNILLTGPTGVGKTWIACALAHKACQSGYTVLYYRLSRLLESLPLAKGDGSYTKVMTKLAKAQVLVLDDWGLTTLKAEQRRDLLEILEDRHGSRATLVTSQLPIDKWHDIIGDPTLADAILDRLVHNAYKINLKGESMRKKQNQLTLSTENE